MKTVDFLEFKKQASSFFKYAKTSTQEQINNGFKQLSISYLWLEGSDIELHQADILICMAANNKQINKE